jgi:hypothetical protein
MQTFRFDELINKHGQSINMFSKQPGNTELEKCINFLNSWNNLSNNSAKFTQFLVNTNIGNVTCVVLDIFLVNTNIGNVTCVVLDIDGVEIFNNKGEKIGQSEDYQINSVDDLYDPLDDIGITLISLLEIK